MAEQVIGFRVDVDTGQGQATVGDLRQQFIEAKKAALEAKEGTEGYAEAIRRLAEKKAAIDQLNQTVRALNPDQLINNFTRLGGAIVGGFTAATSAAALFGAESEDVQKALLKVQAAIGLLHGFQAIQEGVRVFNALAVSIGRVQLAVMGLIGGAAIGGIILLVNWFEKLQGQIFGTMTAMTDHEVEMKKLKLEYQSLTGAISETEKALQLLELEYKKAVQEIQIETETKLKDTTSFWNTLWRVIKGGTIGMVNDTGDAISDVIIEQDKKIEQITQEHEQRKLNIKQAAANTTIKVQRQQNADMDWVWNNELIPLAVQNEAALTETKKQASDLRKRIDAEEAANQREEWKNNLAGIMLMQLDMAGQYASAVGNITRVRFANEMAAAQGNEGKILQIRKRQFESEKRMNVAMAAINGAQAAMKGIAQFGPPPSALGIAAIASASIITALQIAAILSQKFDGGGGGASITAPDFGGVQSTPAPIINPESTILNDNTNSGGGETDREAAPAGNVRAYVVETDITEAQRRIVKLETEASFG